jgi:hypothetical protein
MSTPILSIDVLVQKIATQEGWDNPDPSVVPRRLDNPGDLIYARQGGAVAVKIGSHIFAKWTTPGQGMAWAYAQACLDIARGMSLKQLIMSWAPPSDRNNTQEYLAGVAAGVGIENVDAPLYTFLPMHTIAVTGDSAAKS